MTDTNLKELLTLLTIRTTESKIHWTRTGPESRYGLELTAACKVL